MSDHAPLPPSKAARWAGQMCTASPVMELRYTDEPSQDAEEGRAAHWVATEMLAGKTVNVGTPAPNGLVVDEEMIEAATTYVDDVWSVLTVNPGAMPHIEETERAPGIHPDNWGTPDLWWYSHPRLVIWDFKYGHRFVDAFENWQLLDYLACVLSRPEFVGVDRRNLDIELRVVQPRNYHPAGPVRSWKVDAVRMAQAFARLTDAANEATADPKTRVGVECRDCSARHVCATLHNAADGVADLAGGPVAMELPPDALGVELRYLKRAEAMLSARITGLEAQAMSVIRDGKSVPFFTLASGGAREKWTVPVTEIIAMGELMGVKLAKPDTSLTPAQARNAGLDAAVVKAYSERPPGALKLIPADTMQARKVFGNV